MGPIAYSLYLVVALPIYGIVAIAWLVGGCVYIIARLSAPVLMFAIKGLLMATGACVDAWHRWHAPELIRTSTSPSRKERRPPRQSMSPL